MKITINNIDSNNLMDILKLTTNTDGIPTLIEKFVASNALSISQAKVYPNQQIRAIYDEQTPIGFAMYGIDEDDGKLWLSRFMIDYKYQNKGYGRESFLLLLDEIRMSFPNVAINLSFEPENDIAKKLYKSCGFKATGEVIDNEIVYSLKG